jgi:hypothetical protein
MATDKKRARGIVKDGQGNTVVMIEAEKPRYKMVPVDLQTYERLVTLCQARGRKQGAQVKVMVDAEFQKLPKDLLETA